ncbi:MAG: YeiH family protein [Gammaproteobacteria bacterium]
MKSVFPGLTLAIALALLGQWLSQFIGIDLMGMAKSPLSATMVAIVLGLLIGNTLTLPAIFKPGISFGVKRVLRFGIVALGIRLSLVEVGTIGLQALPVILVAVTTAILAVRYLARRVGMDDRLGTLIAVGTSVCGGTAIVATAPAIGAKDDQVSYAVACITLFGMVAMLVYPFATHWFFDGDGFASGLFLGTAVHDTAQVAGAGLVYQQFYNDPEALNAATVTKLVRNLGMLIIIPLMSILYCRKNVAGGKAPPWYTMVPLFVLGFAAMSLLRTLGDATTPALGFLSAANWAHIVSIVAQAATFLLTIAMACVGLCTSISGIRTIGLKPLAIGLFSALLVGVVSATTISVLY